jgi:putative transposase
MSEIKNRGVNDILIAIIDGLKGFPEAINSVFPQAQIQTCIVHLIRNSLDFCSWKDREPVAKELKTVYRAADAQAAAAALRDFEEGPWANALRRSQHCGAGIGRMSFPSLPIRPRSGK